MARNRTTAQKTAAKNRALRRVMFGALNRHQVAELSADGTLMVRAIDSPIGPYIATSWQTIFLRILLRKGPFADTQDTNYLIQSRGLTREEAYEEAIAEERREVERVSARKIPVRNMREPALTGAAVLD